MPPKFTNSLNREASPVNNTQTNGIWFTKARNTTPPVFPQTPADTAGVSEEALYPDGEHILTFHVEDAAGRIDRAQNKAEDNAKVKVIVDNFRPYVKRIGMQSGTFQVYSSQWTWTRNGNAGTLALSRTTDKKADRAQPLNITVTTSEPIQFTTEKCGCCA